MKQKNKESLNNAFKMCIEGVEYMVLKQDKTFELFLQIWKRIKKNFNKKTKEGIDKILEDYLLVKKINITTYNDVGKSIEINFGKDVRDFILSFLLNPEKVVKELIKTQLKSEEKYLIDIHKKYFMQAITARDYYDFPERWKLLNTDLVQSKNKGFLFRTRVIRYDGKVFYFESLPQDYFTLLDHFIKRLGEVTPEPLDKFLEEINKLNALMESVKVELKKRQSSPVKPTK